MRALCLHTIRAFTGFFSPCPLVAAEANLVGASNLTPEMITSLCVVVRSAFIEQYLHLAPLMETRGIAPQVCAALQSLDRTFCYARTVCTRPKAEIETTKTTMTERVIGRFSDSTPTLECYVRSGSGPHCRVCRLISALPWVLGGYLLMSLK
ncbi:hypothetical protein SKAU_G00205690 [Synaphobranchus kaupii]|uniref:Secreted protein n=1 Tax=Synaphobranchus kaupii TaxID=118154 RepID=A0A9Q1IYT5_SYNKA|nr:hypothetical protein SKAU_G00205690 [Synaphobranchus kaupii]